MKIKEVLRKAYEAGASDIHMMAGCPVMIRTEGRLRPLEESDVADEDMKEVLAAFVTKEKKEILDREGELVFVLAIPGFSRLRIALYRQQGKYAASVRMMPSEVPAPQELEIPDSVLKLAEEKKGLILLTGEAGSGTTTTAASLLCQIAKGEPRHIVTIENPVEYRIGNGTGIVSQREVGSDAKGVSEALKAAVRQDADVIFASELPDADAVLEALKAAEGGRLVITSLRVAQAARALRRLTESVPSDMRERAREQLSGVLKGVVWQQLLPRRDKEGRSAFFEVLLADSDICALIREGREGQIASALSQKRESGSQLMDYAVLDAFMKSKIEAETAAAYAVDETRMRRWMQIY